MSAGSIILEQNENGTFTERHIAKSPAELNAATAAGTVSQPSFTGSSLSMVQPYLAVKFWQRTA